MTTGRSLRIGEAVLSLGCWPGPVHRDRDLADRGGGLQRRGRPAPVPVPDRLGLIVVGVALLRQAFFGHIAHEGGFELDWPAVALVSAGLIVQMLLLERLGWIIATTLLFVAHARLSASAGC